MERSVHSRPLSPAEIVNFSWTETSPASDVMNALQAMKADSARFVGGCVRDSLLGFVPKDIDIATQLTPSEIITALNMARLGAVPTGIAHGTITAIADHCSVEVTSLRSDVSTDGRRATVAFTTNWREDAMRRDFTINALYLDADNNLHDYVDGLLDLEARKVRFIGNPYARIKEDFLRILRFFRFSARFVEGDYDRDGLEACTLLKNGINILSKERIGSEFEKIIKTKNALTALSSMDESGVFHEIWPHEPNLGAFNRLTGLVDEMPIALALAALWGQRGSGLGTEMRLSNADEKRRKNAVVNGVSLKGMESLMGLRRCAYEMGTEKLNDAIKIYLAMDAQVAPAKREKLTNVEAWPIPQFPFRGADVLRNGIEAGPLVSSVLTKTEQRWIEEDFPLQARLDILFDEELRAAQ